MHNLDLQSHERPDSVLMLQPVYISGNDRHQWFVWGHNGPAWLEFVGLLVADGLIIKFLTIILLRWCILHGYPAWTFT